MKIRGKALTSIAVAALLLVACGEGEPVSDSQEPADGAGEAAEAAGGEEAESGEGVSNEGTDGAITEPVRIGWTPPALSPTDFFGQFQVGLEDGLERLGIDYELFTRATSQQGAHDEQFNIVEDLISLDPDLIIMSPTGFDEQFASYEAVNAEGIPLFIANFERPENQDELGFDVLQYSGYSHREGAQVMADYLADTLPPDTQMAILRGVPGAIDDQRTLPVTDKMEEIGIDVVAQEVANYIRDEAFQKTLDIMAANPDVDFIYAISSDMAAGAISALETLGIEPGQDVQVWGYGGTVEELENILEGRQSGTVFRDPVEMGEATAEAIQLLMEGRADEIDPYFTATMQLLTTCEDIVERVPPITFGSEDDAPTLEDCG